MLTEFDKLNPYTKYKKDIVLSLKKDYSFDLYHLAKKHQAMGGFQISLDDLFEQLGLPESYRRIGNLKDRVINPSLEEITANTDIDLTYENIKKGRSVVGFKFTVREKPRPKLIAPERDQKTIDMFCSLSDSQINMYSSILSKVSSISDLAGQKTIKHLRYGFLIFYEIQNQSERKLQNVYLKLCGLKQILKIKKLSISIFC